ncbi:universal stress protein [Arcobacter sp. CECT 8985]|uniref:universal stress protein n=1 Tax=Arcobacter sp. CECT 8985 TaxID=1935424 RepID=UPI00100AA07C|nr:universal stress protein [Arcobacter sp. CECT 8985]RXJ87671.1 universal stress protein [Arcobacter sp. CECT 8985]
MSYVLCCVDGRNFSYDTCDYAILIANNMNLPLKFLNVVERTYSVTNVDLSGSIALGEREDMLEELAQKEEKECKRIKKEGKELLNELKQRAIKTCKNEVSISQIHGEIVENIAEYENEIEALVIGITSHAEHEIGDNVKGIIRAVHKPVLLVNSEYIEPQKMLIAYNGSAESKKLLDQTANNPLFKQIKREIVNITTNEIEGLKLLNEAKEIYSKKNYEVTTNILNGENEDLLVNYFNENDYDILTMGAFGHSRIKEFIFGSFTSKVITKMRKPILLFR